MRSQAWASLSAGARHSAHGYGDRLSLDLDFYVPQFEQSLFDQAEAAVLAALHAAGYQANVGHSDSWLRQIIVTDPTHPRYTYCDCCDRFD